MDKEIQKLYKIWESFWKTAESAIPMLKNAQIESLSQEEAKKKGFYVVIIKDQDDEIVYIGYTTCHLRQALKNGWAFIKRYWENYDDIQMTTIDYFYIDPESVKNYGNTKYFCLALKWSFINHVPKFQKIINGKGPF